MRLRKRPRKVTGQEGNSKLFQLLPAGAMHRGRFCLLCQIFTSKATRSLHVHVIFPNFKNIIKFTMFSSTTYSVYTKESRLKSLMHLPNFDLCLALVPISKESSVNTRAVVSCYWAESKFYQNQRSLHKITKGKCRMPLNEGFIYLK